MTEEEERAADNWREFVLAGGLGRPRERKPLPAGTDTGALAADWEPIIIGEPVALYTRVGTASDYDGLNVMVTFDGGRAALARPCELWHVVGKKEEGE